MASGNSLGRLGRAIKSSGNPAWLPRTPQITMHQGTLTSVDLGNGVADFQFADPSGIIVPSVRVLQAYTSSNLPAEGHTVWMQMYGTDPMIVGQHVFPISLVTP